jgi:hypothetical protein
MWKDRRGQPKKRWVDCVRQDMREMAVRDEMTTDGEEWKENPCCPDPK